MPLILSDEVCMCHTSLTSPSCCPGLLLGHVATPALVAYTEYGSLPYLTQGKAYMLPQ